MNPKHFFRAFTCLIICCTTLLIKAQENKDTIFYNSNWEICEEPVAEYYRVCTLHKNETIFYDGEVRDYTLDNKLILKGCYNTSAQRDGMFSFFYSNGNKEREGLYDKNKMSGIWTYYREDGSIYSKIQFDGDETFTPLLIVGDNGDTIIANGNGKFSLNTADFPDIFSEHYIIEGTCTDGMRDDEWNYYVNTTDKLNILTEHYEHGKFKKGKEKALYDYTHRTKKVAQLVKFNIPKLAKVEHFEADRVFGNAIDTDYQKKLINFLLYKYPPAIKVQSSSFKNNLAYIMPQFRAGIKRHLLGLSDRTRITYLLPEADFSHDTWTVATVSQPSYVREGIDSSITVKTLDNIKAEVRFNIMPDGTLGDLEATTNLTKEFVTPIIYYLAKLRGLMPMISDDHAVATPMKLYLYVKSTEQISASRKFLVSNFIVSTKPNVVYNVK